MNLKPAFIAALILGAFSIVGVGLVSATYEGTKDRIAHNERLSLLRKLEAMVPAETVDNDMVADTIEVHDPDMLGAATTTIYRGRMNGEPVAAVLTPVVPDGYSGPIRLLVAVRTDGSLGGVRVISHKETPGLGDNIEEEKSNWVFDFNGKSLGNPPLEQWKVKRDGGVFDQFTGATITPRSIVQAVKNTLLYVEKQGLEIYQPTPANLADNSGDKADG